MASNYYRGPATISYDLKMDRMGLGSGGRGDKIRTAALGEDEGLGHVLPAADGTQGMASGKYATGYASAAENERTMAEKAGKRRLDRPGYKKGGRVKGTVVNVIVAPQNAPKIAPMPMPGGPPPMPAGGPPLMPPPGAGGPMMGGGPPPMMRKKGGRVPGDNDHDHDPDNDADDRKKRKMGGRVPMTAGALSGEGRLQKIKIYGKNAKSKGGK